MELATRMLAAHGMPVTPPHSARDGRWPPQRVPVSDGDTTTLASAVVVALHADDHALGGTGRLAVLVPRALREQLAKSVAAALGDSPPAGRVDVIGVRAAKGLEFDAVTVVEPGLIVRESARGVHDLYVALTRPTERLTLVHFGPLPAGLGDGDGRPPAR